MCRYYLDLNDIIGTNIINLVINCGLIWHYNLSVFGLVCPPHLKKVTQTQCCNIKTSWRRLMFISCQLYQTCSTLEVLCRRTVSRQQLQRIVVGETKESEGARCVVSPTFIRWVGTGTAVKNRTTRRRGLESALCRTTSTRTYNCTN